MHESPPFRPSWYQMEWSAVMQIQIHVSHSTDAWSDWVRPVSPMHVSCFVISWFIKLPVMANIFATCFLVGGRWFIQRSCWSGKCYIFGRNKSAEPSSTTSGTGSVKKVPRGSSPLKLLKLSPETADYQSLGLRGWCWFDRTTEEITAPPPRFAERLMKNTKFLVF